MPERPWIFRSSCVRQFPQRSNSVAPEFLKKSQQQFAGHLKEEAENILHAFSPSEFPVFPARFALNGLLPVVGALLEHWPVGIGIVTCWRILLVGLILFLLLGPGAQRWLVAGRFLFVQLVSIFDPA